MDYVYRARAKEGRLERGHIEAPSTLEAIERLKSRGLTVSRLVEAHAGRFGALKLSRSVSLQDRTIFTQELSLMLDAGIPLSRVLEDIQDQTDNRRLKAALATITADVRGGTSFGDALAKHTDIFPPLIIAIIRSGEASGKLVEVLERLTFQMEKDAELQGKIKSALLYPAILLIGIIAVLALIIVFVIPQLEGIFTDVGVDLPFITRLLLIITHFLIDNGAWLLIGLFIITISIIILLRQARLALAFDRWKLRLPIFGRLQQKAAVARLSTTATTLLTAGVPVLKTLAISQAVVGNRYYEKELMRVAQAAENGASLATTIRAGRIFPVMLANLLAVGEESGNLAETFGSVAKYYDRDIEASTRNLTALLEPLLMLFMGGGIAFVIAAVLLPIYRLVETL
ncbi:MAG: type II secretion system F family protein [Patescibacteria group bacterium]|mgnify:FL=1